MGRVAKGVKCSVAGCGNEAVRSLSGEKVALTGLEIGKVKRAYLCKDHYKGFKKGTRKERMLERWRQRG